MIEYVLSIHEALDSIPRITKTKIKKKTMYKHSEVIDVFSKFIEKKSDLKYKNTEVYKAALILPY